jgi:tRNA-specific 2-thiouridylase
VFDLASRFKEDVIDQFADAYANGRTPIPCVRCNQGVKFTDLFAIARDLGADCLATGHYVRRVVGGHGPELHRAADPARDQSYFLFATTREQLDFLRFPLGALPKPAVRELARELGLLVADKPDSQDICFVPGGDYAAVVRKVRPEAAVPGEIVDMEGRVLGRHQGLIHFTVGQRRGLEIGGQAEPLYVLRLEPERQRVVVGPRRALAVRAARLSDVNWLGRGRKWRADRQGALAGAAGAGAVRRGGRDDQLRGAGIWRGAGAGGRALRRRSRGRRRLDRENVPAELELA